MWIMILVVDYSNDLVVVSSVFLDVILTFSNYGNG